jgi:hypothetical protein
VIFPVVLIYTAGVFSIFRGKVRKDAPEYGTDASPHLRVRHDQRRAESAARAADRFKCNNLPCMYNHFFASTADWRQR